MPKFAPYLAVVSFVLAGLASFAQAGDTDPELESWLDGQFAYSRQALLGNIGPSAEFPDAARGAVAASASYKPNYRYHWTRDAALTMSTVLGLYLRTSGSFERNRYLELLLDFAAFSRLNQLTHNRSGEADGAGVGEPKFNLDGSAYNDDWGRPQNDGPALRALTLTRLAQQLLNLGDDASVEIVRERLYRPGLPARTVIKVDLEYVAHRIGQANCDLWEEVTAQHFYTSLVQRRALIEGATLAERVGDPGAARFYRGKARELESMLERYWDGSRGYLLASIDWQGGHAEKTSQLDVSVVLGVLHGSSREDSYFGVTDDRVIATARKLEEAFSRAYRINQQGLDEQGRLLGTAIGRYAEDLYAGEGPGDRGNPWFLATAAFAEFQFRLAEAYQREGRIRVTHQNVQALRAWVPLVREVPGEVIERGRSDRFAKLVRGLRESGDSYLRRIRRHADPSGALSEQFNRDTGTMQSAEELTWSHASILTADWARTSAAR